MATLFLVDDNVTYKAVDLQGESSWTVELVDNGTAGLTVDFLGLEVATSVTVVSKGPVGGDVSLGQLAEVPNDLTTVTIKGSEAFSLGSGLSGESNSGDGAVTDVNAKAASATAIHSSLTLIDASATSGGVIIYAGATNTSGAGDFQDGSGSTPISRSPIPGLRLRAARATISSRTTPRTVSSRMATVRIQFFSAEPTRRLP